LTPALPAAPFGHFLAALDDGDLATGAFTPPALDPGLHAARPGYDFILARWNLYLPTYGCPWPFWIFPPGVLPPPPRPTLSPTRSP
jgi:hypothetical protein